jgi:NitT/TauT family transport system substrate-binding protein
MGKRAAEAGVCVEVELIPDYITSLETFTNGNAQGVTVTNMDLLSFQSSTGDSEVIILGDYSNGNDAILVRSDEDEVTMASLKGKEVGIVELSVNDYLLERCAANAGLTRKDFNIVNFTSEGDIAAQYGAQSDGDFAAVVWNPVLLQLQSSLDDSHNVCDSSSIPGEILDVLVVDAETPDATKQAIVNAWYDTMKVMSQRSKAGKAAREVMAQNADNTVAEYERQLKTTGMWYSPAKAAEFMESAQMVTTTKSVYDFTRRAGIVTDEQSVAINGTAVISEAGEPTINYNSTFTRNAAK